MRDWVGVGCVKTNYKNNNNILAFFYQSILYLTIRIGYNILIVDSMQLYNVQTVNGNDIMTQIHHTRSDVSIRKDGRFDSNTKSINTAFTFVPGFTIGYGTAIVFGCDIE